MSFLTMESYRILIDLLIIVKCLHAFVFVIADVLYFLLLNNV
jgi:hypothetical protein